MRFLRNMFRKKDHYQCWYCGYIIPKKDVVDSGYDSESSMKHFHCPKCGKYNNCKMRIAEPNVLIRIRKR